MRRMADSVTPSNLPAGFDVYGGYDDGSYSNIAAIKALHPNKPVVCFTVFARDNFGDCLDVEAGDATPAQAPGWTYMRRVSGHPQPMNYCSEGVRDTLLGEYAKQHITVPPLIIAAYPGNGAVLQQPHDAGHQFIDHGPYDESVVIDFMPGVDITPPHPSTIGAEMIASTPSGNGYWKVTPNDGAIYSYGDAQWLGALNWPKNVLNPSAVVTGFASHPTQEGYWIATSDGGVYAFGASHYFAK